MGWYDSNYRFRVPITVYHATGGTRDVRITVPKSWDRFWNSIESTGYDIRVTSSDGLTLVSYMLQSFTYASRVGVIDLDNVSLAAADTNTVFWLYFEYSAAASAASVFTGASVVTGVIFPAFSAGGRLFKYGGERPGVTKPLIDVQKLPNERVMLWIDFLSVLVSAIGGGQYHQNFDEIAQISVDVQAAASSQAAMVDQSETVLVGRTLVGAYVKAGTSGTNYVLIVKITTSEGYIYEQRAKVRVYSVAE